MGLCFSTNYAEEPVHQPPVQRYRVQQQQEQQQQQQQQRQITPTAPPMDTFPQPSAPRFSFSQPIQQSYVPYSQYTYAVPYSQKQSFSNEDPQPVQWQQPQQYTPTVYPPQSQVYYVQQPVYRPPVQQQTNTTTAAIGGFVLGSVLADMFDDD